MRHGVMQHREMNMRKCLKKVGPLLLVFAGAALLFYPFISEYLFEHRVDSEIVTYADAVKDLEDMQYSTLLADARIYNQALTESQAMLTDPFITAGNETAEEVGYGDVLAVDDTGIMAYVEIPAISVYLPVYHGTSSAVLENGTGHLEGTSLPVGGPDTHAVITGHTGMNRAKLFTDLAEMEKGDLFFIHVLNETLAYQVDEINTVLPEDTSKLVIQKGEDMVTLITCTPYGVNTHRLLVTGKRVPYDEEIYSEAADEENTVRSSQWMSTYRKAILAGMILTGAFLMLLLFVEKQKKKQEGRKEETEHG